MNTLSASHRMLTMPLARAYARHFVGDQTANGMLRALAAWHFWVYHRYWPHLAAPRSFEEKLTARMLFDRNPLWTTFCDKWQSRDFVRARGCEECLIPVLWHGADPDRIPLQELPRRFVIKASHGCGYNIVVTDHERFDWPLARRCLAVWLRENFCDDKYIGTEWGYRNVPPTILIEQFIGKDDKVPVDYKFFCFGGKVEYVLMNFDRFGDHAKVIVDRAFKPTGLDRGRRRYEGELVSPPNYHGMIEVAETLAHGIDFVRVDLYNVDGQIYFGELTCYPGGGTIPFTPRAQDFVWGAKWQLAPFIGHESG